MSESDIFSVDWQDVVAASMDGIGITDRGTVVHVDDELAAIFGYDEPGALVDNPWRELYPSAECERIEREGLDQNGRDGPWRDDVTGLRADGSPFLHELSVYRTGDGAFIWSVRDVSEHETPATETDQNDHQYRRLFDAAPVPIGVFTADDEIVYCNQAAVDFLGADDREDVVGRSPEAFVHPDDLEQVGRRITQVIEERESTAPLKERFVGLDGEERVAVVASTPATYDGEPAAEVVMNDVTDYERMQAQLEAKQLFLQSVMDAVDDVVYVIDEGGEFYDWNDEAAETLGYTHEELGNMHPMEVIPEDHHEYVPGLMDAIDAIEDRRVDVDLLTKDGERLTHEFKGTTFEHPETGEYYRCGVARDVTEVRQLQRELREEHRFVQNVVDALDDVLYVVGEDGEFAFWNRELRDRFGYDDEEVGELDPHAFLAPTERDELPLDPANIVDVRDRHNVVNLVTADGEPIPHELHGVTYTDQQTGSRYRVGLARDITERLERQRELERYETIIETVDDGVYALDENLEFTFANERLCEMFGTSREELIGTHGAELFANHDDFAETADVRSSAVEGDADGATIRGAVPTPEGERIFESRYRLHPEPDDEYRGSVGVVRDVTEVRKLQRELREEHRFIENVVDALDDVLYVVDEDGNFVLWNDEANDRFGYDDQEMAEIDPTDFVDSKVLDDLPLDPVDIFGLPGRHDIDLLTKDGEPIPHELHGVTYTDEGTGDSYRIGIARDVTERLERERELERQRDDLATLDHINEVLFETTREVIETASREAVERTVCERLAATDLYQFVWVGEPELDGDRIVPRITAGDGHGYLDEVTIRADGRETGLGPVGRAMQTGEVQVADITDPAFAPWRDAATERGFESVAAVPLHHEGSVYGVMAIYATRDGAFSLREQAGFDVLGRAVGTVIYAARSRDLLFADAVVALEFDVDRPASDLLAAAVDLECELALDGYVSSGKQWILYITVDGVRPDIVIEELQEDSRVDRARVINEGDDGGLVELVLDELLMLDAVSAVGATVRAVTADPTGARVIVEAPVDAEIREVVNHVQNEYPRWDLVATRERDREVATVGRPDGPLDGLTDRQREALEAGLRAGYYAWPRESTAEEVATSLDLAPATLHGHLRKAEGTILTALLDGE